MTNSTVRLVDCSEAEHAASILVILNEAITHSTALYDYVPRPPEAMAAWFATKRANGFPVVGAVDPSGKLLGFASWGTFRAFPAYKYTVEHSVYVHHEHRGQGLGKTLIVELVRRALALDLHALVGCIDASNAGSIALHERLGFMHSGTLRQVGFKFGRWLDAAFYQLLLETPARPVDGTGPHRPPAALELTTLTPGKPTSPHNHRTDTHPLRLRRRLHCG